MKNIKNCELLEMTDDEYVSTNGGGPVLIAIAISAAFYLLSEYDDIKRGWNDAGSGKPYNYNSSGCGCSCQCN